MIGCQIAYSINKQDMVIALKGELRFSAGNTLDDAFWLMKEQWNSHNLVIELTEANFIDSTIYGLIVYHVLEYKKLSDNQAIVYYDSDDIGKELQTLGINQLCSLKAELSPYHDVLSEFTVVLQSDKDSDTKQTKQLKAQIKKAHKALVPLTDDPALQAVVDTIHNQNKGH
tara:strand:+ start:72835 stop:73347 length:513 start_codon:yes stop_codon:yes gene_type:complete